MSDARNTAFRLATALVLTTALSYWTMTYMGIAPIGVDDANILFVYSKHLALGEGLVYNIGGERVEGFSSMLWMLVASVGYLFSTFPYLYFLTLNVLLVSAATAFAIYHLDSRLDDPVPGASESAISLPSLIFLAWMIANPSFYLWAVASLMETGLWAALLLSLTVFLLGVIHKNSIDRRAVIVLALLMSAIVLTRPEGVAWSLSACTLLLLVARAQGHTWVGVLRIVGPVAGAAALTLAALTAFRLAYFGFPLPNTYYVKVTPDKLYNLRFGIVYFYQFVVANPVAVPLILAAVFSFARNLYPSLRTIAFGADGLTARRLAEFSLAGLTLVGLILPILMGGDIFGAFRFFQPVWPLLIMTLFYLPLPVRWWQIDHRLAGLAMASAVVVLVTLTSTVRWPDLGQDRARVRHLFQLSQRHMLTGQYLHDLFDDFSGGLPVLGVSAAGGYKIGYSGAVIDLMGLNFLPMAHHDGDKKGTRGHAAFDKAIFWQYPPDLFEPTLCPRNRPPENRIREPGNWLFEIYREMPADEQFASRYRFVALDVPGTTDRICTYASNEWLGDIRSAGYGVEFVD